MQKLFIFILSTLIFLVNPVFSKKKKKPYRCFYFGRTTALSTKPTYLLNKKPTSIVDMKKRNIATICKKIKHFGADYHCQPKDFSKLHTFFVLSNLKKANPQFKKMMKKLILEKIIPSYPKSMIAKVEHGLTIIITNSKVIKKRNKNHRLKSIYFCW